MPSIRTIAALAAVTAFASAVPALAQDVPQAAAAQASHQESAFGEAATLAAADLGAVTGREDVGTLIARADQRNTVSNNSVTGSSVTGAVSLDGNAFQNLQGMAVISANSGNNVAMNSAMNVTINMAPPR